VVERLIRVDYISELAAKLLERGQYTVLFLPLIRLLDGLPAWATLIMLFRRRVIGRLWLLIFVTGLVWWMKTVFRFRSSYLLAFSRRLTCLLVPFFRWPACLRVVLLSLLLVCPLVALLSLLFACPLVVLFLLELACLIVRIPGGLVPVGLLTACSVHQ